MLWPIVCGRSAGGVFCFALVVAVWRYRFSLAIRHNYRVPGKVALNSDWFLRVRVYCRAATQMTPIARMGLADRFQLHNGVSDVMSRTPLLTQSIFAARQKVPASGDTFDSADSRNIKFITDNRKASHWYESPGGLLVDETI